MSLEDLSFEARDELAAVVRDGLAVSVLLAERNEAPGLRTVLGYGHGDVVLGMEDRWTKGKGPWTTARDGDRLYGRGTADDKCGVAIHAAALRAFGAKPPVTVKVLVEGEEESSTEHLPFLIGGHRDLLAADIIGVADGGNWRSGVPTLETSIRGVVDCRVTVRVLDLAVHSGVFGGPIPDALSALARILASLHHDDGSVAIVGLRSGPWDGVQIDEDSLRHEAPMRPGVRFIGRGTVAERLWTGPAVSVLGIDAPRVREASIQLVPVASAKVSLRLAPDEDAVRARELLAAHLRDHAPWGVETTVEPGEAGSGLRIRDDGPAASAMKAAMEEAYGTGVARIGSGGSVPLVPVLHETFPDAEILMYGASDERSQYHSIDESVDLRDLERTALAEALWLARLGS